MILLCFFRFSDRLMFRARDLIVVGGNLDRFDVRKAYYIGLVRRLVLHSKHNRMGGNDIALLIVQTNSVAVKKVMAINSLPSSSAHQFLRILLSSKLSPWWVQKLKSPLTSPAESPDGARSFTRDLLTGTWKWHQSLFLTLPDAIESMETYPTK